MSSANIVSPTTYLAWTGGFGAAGLVLLLYGIYINLFILAIYTLSRQKKTAGKNVLLLACCTMFVLGTADTILWVWSDAVNISILQELVDTGAHLDQADFRERPPLFFVSDIVFALNNLVTDFLFLYRCYKIWGSRKMAVILPATLIFTTVVIASVANVANTIFPPSETIDVLIRLTFVLSAATNLVLMGLTAGRIWWLQRKTIHGVGVDDTSRSRYKMPIVLILESGALYAVCSMVLVILGRNENIGVYPIIAGASSQILNIAPTLIVVRVGLGHNIQDSVSTVQTNDTQLRQVQVPTSSWTRAVNKLMEV